MAGHSLVIFVKVRYCKNHYSFIDRMVLTSKASTVSIVKLGTINDWGPEITSMFWVNIHKLMLLV